ncbi:uncharacterized protein PODANS_5_10900 [Podospora anserina S mat+]|uniref:Podospora anserina S mat+ genomic DNA chromosome 5, supercontig 10 n=1 Tax=Podospora anserina (strain S / ATCC MYA-4624 / DSM 980 / FGSC 10383) TaxID=515849 RepID=B2APP3_PODAN|nr:uncharacterized protein PODANS_5_10900 [Podospora anserina S mat+]CAP65883.1 unnamed protein product [Podospora anserina S mat+]CDP30255.1 Putative protein of unknown function [Podospora anserina S mat+]
MCHFPTTLLPTLSSTKAFPMDSLRATIYFCRQLSRVKEESPTSTSNRDVPPKTVPLSRIYRVYLHFDKLLRPIGLTAGCQFLCDQLKMVQCGFVLLAADINMGRRKTKWVLVKLNGDIWASPSTAASPTAETANNPPTKKEPVLAWVQRSFPVRSVTSILANNGSYTDNGSRHPDQIEFLRLAPHRPSQPTKSCLKIKSSPTDSKISTEPRRVSFAETQSTCIMTSEPYTPSPRSRKQWRFCLVPSGVRSKPRETNRCLETRTGPVSKEEKWLDERLTDAIFTSFDERARSPQCQDKEYQEKKWAWKRYRRMVRKREDTLSEQARKELVGWLEEWVRRYTEVSETKEESLVVSEEKEEQVCSCRTPPSSPDWD